MRSSLDINTHDLIAGLELRTRDRRPLYEQLADGIAELIRNDELKAEARLPALRDLARTHGIALVTASQAYELLAAQGLITSRTGRGTFVETQARRHTPAARLPERRPATAPPQARVGGAGPSPLQSKIFSPQSWRYETFELLRASARPGSLVLSAGHTAPESYPLADFAQCFARTFLEDPPELHQYRVDRGDETLRELCAERLRSRGAEVSADDILIVSGAQQALSLIAQALLRPGDLVAAEAPTYFAALETIDQQQVRWLSVATDSDGVRVESLAQAVRLGPPRLLYMNTAAQNPTGAFLARSRHRMILALAERANMFVFEDQTSWQLNFDGEAPPPLFASDRGGHVILIESFSKVLFPSLRVGYIAAKGAAMQRLLAAKLRADSFTSTVSQRALVRFMQSKAPARHIRASRRLYRRRRDALAAAVRPVLPAGSTMHVPPGGLNLWVELPRDWSARELLSYSAAEGVLFLPGEPFYPTDPAANTLRLSYGTLPEADAKEAAARLGNAVRAYAKAKRHHDPGDRTSAALMPAV